MQNKGNAATAIAQINKARQAAKKGIVLPTKDLGISKADFLALLNEKPNFFKKKV